MRYGEALERLRELKRGRVVGAKSHKSPVEAPNFRECPGVSGAKSAETPPEADVLAWLNANPPPPQADPSLCLVCGEPETTGRPLIPILTGARAGRRWLHDHCWSEHWRRRRAEAEAALLGCAR